MQETCLLALGSGRIGEIHSKQEIAPAFPITGGLCFTGFLRFDFVCPGIRCRLGHLSCASLSPRDWRILQTSRENLARSKPQAVSSHMGVIQN